MPAYDEVLAQQILSVLQEAFPRRLSSYELKMRLPSHDVPENRLLLALDALFRLGLISGKALRSDSGLDDLANIEITSHGQESLSTVVIDDVNVKHGPSKKDSETLVTVGGECFEAKFIGVGRDGLAYLFKLKDLVKDRGQRSVAIRRSWTGHGFIEDFDARVETVRLNLLRRAFDSGAFNFEKPVAPDHFYELSLLATDFQPQKKADDETVRRFIKFGAYFLGFKFAPSGPNPFLDFDCPEDLEYLGATAEDIHRNVWLLIQKGYLNKSSAATFDHPSRCSPTSKLIDEIEEGDSDSPQLIVSNELAVDSSAGKWTKKEIVAAVVVPFLAVLVGSALALMTPEVRRWLDLDKPQEQHAPIQSVPAPMPHNDSTTQLKPDHVTSAPEERPHKPKAQPRRQESKEPKIPQVSAPNGIAIGGGTVINPIVNNYGPQAPTPTFELFDRQPLPESAAPQQWVRIKIDRTFLDPKFAIICDRPCKALGAGMVLGPGGGIAQVNWGTIPNSENIAAISVNQPNPMPSDAKVEAVVASEDDKPVRILSVRSLTIDPKKQ